MLCLRCPCRSRGEVDWWFFMSADSQKSSISCGLIVIRPLIFWATIYDCYLCGRVAVSLYEWMKDELLTRKYLTSLRAMKRRTYNIVHAVSWGKVGMFSTPTFFSHVSRLSFTYLINFYFTSGAFTFFLEWKSPTRKFLVSSTQEKKLFFFRQLPTLAHGGDKVLQ